MSRIPEHMIAALERTDPYDLKKFVESGPSYFNPLLGRTLAETFENLADVLGFLHGQLAPLADGSVPCIAERQHALALIVQTAWSAAQFEGFRPKHTKGGEV